MHLLILTKDLADNSTGRAHVVWQLARSLGWTSEVVAPIGAELWAPLVGSEFEADARVVPSRPAAARAELHEAARRADLIVAVKPVPGTLGRALKLRRDSGTPILLDIDDPDLESRLGSGHPLEALGKAVLRPRTFWPSVWLRRRMRSIPRIVSNPVLERRYGGTIVPHARADFGVGAAHIAREPLVVFVGTVRKNKGLLELRAAIERLQDVGYRLTVTDHAPLDAKPWESWVGPSTIADGQRLVQSADVVVLVSDKRMVHSHAQLPAKLIDAMVAGRAIVIADVEPMIWATAGASLQADAAVPGALDDVLRRLTDPALRTDLGGRARDRALSSFALDVVADRFRDACIGASGEGSAR